MAIKTIEISNIMVFQRHWEKDSDSFRLEFCDGINVLIVRTESERQPF